MPIVEFVPDEAALSKDRQYTVFSPAFVELSDTINRLIAEIEKHVPDRLVIDSLSELRLLASDKMRYRRQLLALKQYLAERNRFKVALISVIRPANRQDWSSTLLNPTNVSSSPEWVIFPIGKRPTSSQMQY